MARNQTSASAPLKYGGSTIKTMRFGDELLEEMEHTIQERNTRTRKAPWTFTDFVHQAVREKLKHMARGRRSSKRSKITEAMAKIAQAEADAAGLGDRKPATGA